jgi:RNA polymerase sigma-70 factor (ECF subfamily)
MTISLAPDDSREEQGRVLTDFRGSLRAAKRGDQDAFARLWAEFQPGLLRYLTVKAGPVAEDLAADTWVRVLRALPTFEGDEAGFRAWLFTTARNRLIDWYRGSSRRFEYTEFSKLDLMPASTCVESDADENSATRAALSLISQLPPDQSEAVMLRIVAGLDVATVAKIMRRSSGSVRVLCHRGLRRLESSLSADARAEPDAVEGTAATLASPLDDDLRLVPEVRLHG